ncbi:hypothetical protein SAMN05444487_101427 [Marininema mesophilum]|uniref:Uncharacterized protein n=1 Tax=Marininema mesophilum TaxID=1048340 RepID=A0A1H2RDY7_9BACL|nr:hypothetical protein [Marininema mesophilum]SDW16879.1 hypothetical protein SAMN05444487_101427 [Marininema mesophilum]
MMSVKVTDDAAWGAVKKGKLTGFSIMGLREPVLKSAQGKLLDDPDKAAATLKGAIKRTTLADLGDDWYVNAVSLVDEPCVPKAKFIAIKSKETANEGGFFAKLLSAMKEEVANLEGEPQSTEKSKGDDEMTEEEIKAIVKSVLAEAEAEQEPEKPEEKTTEEIPAAEKAVVAHRLLNNAPQRMQGMMKNVSKKR